MNIDVSADTARAAARVEVDTFPSGTVTYTIERRSPSGNVAGVRGHVDRAFSADPVILRDWEVPFDVALVYTVTAYNASGGVLGTATASFTYVWGECDAWLVDLARPTNSITLEIESMETLDFEVPVGVHRILDRRAPILTTLPAWTPDTELSVITKTLGERDQVRALYGSGYPFLLRTSPDLGVGNVYFGVTDFKEVRPLQPGRAALRRFVAECVQVERPDPRLFVPVPPNTYQEVRDTFATYQALLDDAVTYENVAYAVAGGGSADPVTPWLPDDV